MLPVLRKLLSHPVRVVVGDALGERVIREHKRVEAVHEQHIACGACNKRRIAILHEIHRDRLNRDIVALEKRSVSQETHSASATSYPARQQIEQRAAGDARQHFVAQRRRVHSAAPDNPKVCRTSLVHCSARCAEQDLMMPALCAMSKHSGASAQRTHQRAHSL
jgi:hypothetical protein